MTQENNIPNLYQLSSDELVISYITSNKQGQPQLDYQGPRGTLSFTGPELRIEQTTLGTLVTVFLVRTVDTGSVTFTLLVPGVNLAGTGDQPVQTIAIETNNLFSVLQRNTARQTQTYQVYNLIGAADFTSI